MEDLESYWRNKDLILKESKMPEIKTTTKPGNIDIEDSFEEIDE